MSAKYRVGVQSDENGRYHVWTIPDGPHDLPTVEDLYREAREQIDDFDSREFDLWSEMLKPGAYHLTEKGFQAPHDALNPLRMRTYPGGVTR